MICSNIDRYAAIWQAAHPNSWVEIPDCVEALAGEDKPFRKQRAAPGGADTFWVGDEARDFTNLGNYYEDAYNPEAPMSPEAVKQRFRYLYEWSIRQGRRGAGFGQIPPEMEPLEVLEKAQVFDYKGVEAGEVPVDIGPVLGDGDQESMGVAAAAASDGVAAAEEAPSEPIEAPAIVAPSEQVLEVPTTAATPGTTATSAFTNIPSGATNVADPDVDESKYYRDWYIDNQVER